MATVPMNMRTEAQVRNLIDQAARLSGRNRTEFVVEAAVERAREVILDQRLINVDQETYQRFLDALDAPPAGNSRLKKLMESRAPWE